MGVMRPAGTVNVQDGGRSSNETGEARGSKVQAVDGGGRVRGPRPSWYYSSTQHSGLSAYIVLRVDSRLSSLWRRDGHRDPAATSDEDGYSILIPIRSAVGVTRSRAL